MRNVRNRRRCGRHAARFASIFGDAQAVHIVVSEEAATYRPEMDWLAEPLGNARFKVQRFTIQRLRRRRRGVSLLRVVRSGQRAERKEDFRPGCGEAHPPHAATQTGCSRRKCFSRCCGTATCAASGGRNWAKGSSTACSSLVPYTWMVDPTPLPPHAAIPELNLTDWQQLKTLSQKERDLILKVSGFSAHAWGARGVYLGSDLSHADWAAAVDAALRSFERSPFVLQRYHKPELVEAQWFDFERNELVPMKGRARSVPVLLCGGRRRRRACQHSAACWPRFARRTRKSFTA